MALMIRCLARPSCLFYLKPTLHLALQWRSNQVARRQTKKVRGAHSSRAKGQAVETLEVVPNKDVLNGVSEAQEATPTACLLSLLQTSENLTTLAPSEGILLGIDPDSKGAISVLHFTVSSGETPLWNLQASVVDIPQTRVDLGSRTRSQIDVSATANIVKQLFSKSLQNFSILEHPSPTPLSGKISWMQSGYGYGVWTGMLAMVGCNAQVVSSRKWKIDLQLNKKGKEGSRELALQMFPELQPHLRRKKDHGRAEALLLAAWALGLRHDANLNSYLVADSILGGLPAAPQAGEMGLDEDQILEQVEAGEPR